MTRLNMFPNFVQGFKKLIHPESIRSGDLLLVRQISPDRFHSRIEKFQKRFWNADDARWTHAAMIKNGYKTLEMTKKGTKKSLWSNSVCNQSTQGSKRSGEKNL